MLVQALVTIVFSLFSMHILPSSHGAGVFEHGVPAEAEAKFIEYGMMQKPKPDQVLLFCI